ncbi:hypothetical protein J3R82DRAFT_4821 [Butyriboletus roseoflavus]|nr:hypothetical protein J3R82DRAFT_4821 [Butyriboletus roseoflavus]
MNTQSLTGIPGIEDFKVSVVKPDAEPLGAAYALSPEQATFFKAQTGIDDDDDLRTHILEVQERAFKIFPYPCIRWFMFLQLRITTLPEYEDIIKLGQERPDGILLDIGCCFGGDARKAIADGFPLKNTVTTDLKKGKSHHDLVTMSINTDTFQEFYDMGHALFKTTPETYPISFVAGDAFDPNMLQIVPPFDEAPSTERPDLSTLTSLNPLAGRCAVIYASNFFHLFSEENQLRLAKAVAGLLSPLPGSMICGEHVGNWQKGFGVFHDVLAGKIFDMFQHSPESWNAMWDGEVFTKGKVRVDTRIESVKRTAGLAYNRLQWSVVRL